MKMNDIYTVKLTGEKKARVDDLQKEAQHLMERASKLRGEARSIIESEAIVQVGDMVVDRRGARARITKIRGDTAWGGHRFSFRGVRVLKNGTDGKENIQLHSYQGWQKEEANEARS